MDKSGVLFFYDSVYYSRKAVQEVRRFLNWYF